MIRNNCMSYIEFNVKLFGCVRMDQLEEVRQGIERYLRNNIETDFKDDIEVEIGEGAGM